jgi:DNA-binding transcriptional regulator YiaG
VKYTRSEIKAAKDLRLSFSTPVQRMEVNARALGNDLRKRREKANLSLREVARRSGISAPYLSDCEKGNRTATPRVVLAVIAATSNQDDWESRIDESR